MYCYIAPTSSPPRLLVLNCSALCSHAKPPAYCNASPPLQHSLNPVPAPVRLFIDNQYTTFHYFTHSKQCQTPSPSKPSTSPAPPPTTTQRHRPTRKRACRMHPPP